MGVDNGSGKRGENIANVCEPTTCAARRKTSSETLSRGVYALLSQRTGWEKAFLEREFFCFV